MLFRFDIAVVVLLYRKVCLCGVRVCGGGGWEGGSVSMSVCVYVWGWGGGKAVCVYRDIVSHVTSLLFASCVD